jgi:transposase
MVRAEVSAMAQEAGQQQEGVGWTPPRGRWTSEDGKRMVAAFLAAGVSPGEFGARHGIESGKVTWWLRRFGKRTRARRSTPGPSLFAPVRLVRPPGSSSAGAKTGSGRINNAATLEVVLGGGRSVRVGRDFDETHLRRVVAALEGEGRC